MRCCNNYGPYQFPEKLIPLLIHRIVHGEPLPIYGDGTNVRDWLYLTDHCEAIWTVIDKGAVGRTYNIGGNNEKQNIEVVDTLCQIVAEETNAPVEQLLSLKEFVTDRPGHDMRYAIDATRIRNECGWEPKETFDTGLRKTVKWYLSNQEWVDDVRSGDYRKWMELNYRDRAG